MRRILTCGLIGAGLLWSPIAQAQTSDDVFDAVESVLGQSLSSSVASPVREDGVEAWAYAFPNGTAISRPERGLRNAGLLEIRLDRGAEWTALRKALVSAIGPADTRRGQQVLVWKVTDGDASFTDHMSVVLSKTATTSILRLDRRRSESDPDANVAMLDAATPRAAPKARARTPFASGPAGVSTASQVKD